MSANFGILSEKFRSNLGKFWFKYIGNTGCQCSHPGRSGGRRPAECYSLCITWAGREGPASASEPVSPTLAFSVTDQLAGRRRLPSGQTQQRPRQALPLLDDHDTDFLENQLGRQGPGCALNALNCPKDFNVLRTSLPRTGRAALLILMQPADFWFQN